MIFGMTSTQYEEAIRRANQDFAQAQADRAKSNETPARKWESLGLHEWIQVMRDLGWWDPTVTEAQFWDRATSLLRSYPDPQMDEPSPSPSPSPSQAPLQQEYDPAQLPEHQSGT